MRIFISSTVFDLIDVRAEIADQLKKLGLIPVLSDDKLSEFDVKHGMNSIETCLVNVESCNEVIVILDQRYGPKLGSVGYEDISATHLEYKKAVELGIPVRVYVRDRLEADYSIWKKNNRTKSVNFNWIKPDNLDLFNLLDEHRSLIKNAISSNWYSTFTNSIDLKHSLVKEYEKRILPSRLIQAIQENTFPVIDLDLDVTFTHLRGTNALKFSAILKNLGGTPAFNFHTYWSDRKDDEKTSKDLLAPAQSILMSVLVGIDRSFTGTKVELIAEYESPIGVRVCDRFSLKGYLASESHLVSGGTLIERKYYRTDKLSLDIIDDQDEQT